MEGRFLLDVVIGESASIFQLLSGKDQTLLIRRDALLVLDFGLDVIDGVGGLHVKRDRLSGERLDENLHSSAKAEHQVESGFLLDVVIGESASVFQLLPGKDQTLLIRGDAFLVLDLRLHIVDRVRRFNIEGDRLSGERLDEDLHPSTETEDQVESGFLLNVVIRERAAILELLTGENQTLLIRGNTFLVLDLRLDIVNRVRRLDVKGDGLASQGLDKDLHTPAETQHQVKGRLFLDVIVGQRATVLELFTGEDQSLLIGGNSFLVLNLGLDIVNGIRRLDVESDGFTRQGFHENLTQ